MEGIMTHQNKLQELLHSLEEKYGYDVDDISQMFGISIRSIKTKSYSEKEIEKLTLLVNVINKKAA